MAIKLGKEGDLTGSDSIVWSHTRGLAYTASPVLHDNKLYVVTDNGMISAFNATTGEPHYAQVRLPKAYNLKASPVGANGKLYLATEDGDVVVLRMGEKFEVIATNTLADRGVHRDAGHRRRRAVPARTEPLFCYQSEKVTGPAVLPLQEGKRGWRLERLMSWYKI